MHKFAYFSKFDPNKEDVMTWSAPSIEEARRCFAAFKSVDLKTFDRLFEVVRYDRS